MFNKRMFKKINDKKILHKVGKRWVVVSAVLLGLLGGGTVVSHGVSHAASVTPVQNTNVSKATQVPMTHPTSEAANQTMKVGAMNDSSALDAVRNSLEYASDYASGSARVNNEYNYVNSVANAPELQENSSLQGRFNNDKVIITSASEIINNYPSPETLLPDVHGAERATSDAEVALTMASDEYGDNGVDSSTADSRLATAASAAEYTNSVANSPEIQEDSTMKDPIDNDESTVESDLEVVSCDSGRLSRDASYVYQAQSIASNASNLFVSASDYDKYTTSSSNSAEEASSYMDNSALESASAEKASASYLASSLAASQNSNSNVYYSFIPPSNVDDSVESSQSTPYSNSAELISEMSRHRHYAKYYRKHNSKYLSSASFRGLSRSHRSVTTLKGLKAYRRTRRGRYVHAKYIRRNTRLAVKRVLRRGRTVQLELTNGLLITANKHFVTITKFTRRHARRRNIRRPYRRDAKLSRFTKALRKSSHILRYGRRRSNKYAYREAKRFTKTNDAKKRAYRKFVRRHTYRNRKALRKIQNNLNSLINALLK